tara:strand:+ start:2825 stop:3568 length:744 start_codon:yes stop_codon:yes gene_type:complete
MSEDGINRVALVTGANRGIGLAIFKAFYHSNYTVIGTYRSASGEEILNNIITDESRGAAMRMDVTSKDDVADVFQAIRDKYGPVSTLVNNAGITQDNLFIRMKNKEWDEVINTNLNSVFRVTKESIKDMVKSKYGRIINIGSVVGLSGNPGQVNYASSKSALLGFTKSLAREFASRNITVNIISPGFIETDMTKKLTDEQQTSITKSIPLSRLGNSDDVANLAMFLASDKASYITGENINVNGGLYM